jgi:hypothetical protein
MDCCGTQNVPQHELRPVAIKISVVANLPFIVGESAENPGNSACHENGGQVTLSVVLAGFQQP